MQLKHALSLSFLLHLLLFLGSKVWFYESQKQEPQPEKWLEFQESSTTPMSDQTRRVKKQTRIHETGPSTLTTLQPPSNAVPTPQRDTSKDTRHQGSQKGKTLSDVMKVEAHDYGDVVMGNSAMSSGKVTPQMRQRLQSFLPRDLELGDMVALNTDQNLYFNFYSRMAEKVVWPWAQSVMSGFEHLRRTGQLGNGGKAWITTVEVLLDPNGKVISVQPLQLSGTMEIDSAPTRAFQQAKNFPNPPAEMVEEDGYIHIRYKFIVYYNPRTGP